MVFLVNTGDDREVERTAIDVLGQQQVDGVLYACMYHRVVTLPEGLGPRVVPGGVIQEGQVVDACAQVGVPVGEALLGIESAADVQATT